MDSNVEVAKIIIELLMEIGKVLMEAFSSNDPSKLMKVTDILPQGHALRSRAELVRQRSIAATEFSDLDPRQK